MEASIYSVLDDLLGRPSRRRPVPIYYYSAQDSDARGTKQVDVDIEIEIKISRDQAPAGHTRFVRPSVTFITM